MVQAANTLSEIEALPEQRCEITLLELVAAVAEVAENDAEVVAAVSELVNSGRVRLIGNFRGADVRIG